MLRARCLGSAILTLTLTLTLTLSLAAGSATATGTAARAATAESPTSPTTMLHTYWAALREADTLKETQPFRLDGLPAHQAAAERIAANGSATTGWLAAMQDLAARYRIDRIEPLVSTGGERRLRVVLTPRDATANHPVRTAEVGVVRSNGLWQLGLEDWGLKEHKPEDRGPDPTRP